MILESKKLKALMVVRKIDKRRALIREAKFKITIKASSLLKGSLSNPKTKVSLSLKNSVFREINGTARHNLQLYQARISMNVLFR